MVIAWRLRAGARAERGLSMLELTFSVMVLGFVVLALGVAFSVGFRGSLQAQSQLPGPRTSNELAFWLASDISSAVPVNVASWLNTGVGTASGCSGSTPGQNVLRIETRNPIKPNASAETYVASYRYDASTSTLWRTFCRTGQAPTFRSQIARDINPAAPPGAIVAGDQRSATVAFQVVAKGQAFIVSQRAAVRVPETAPPVATITTTTLPPEQACSYSAGSITPPTSTRFGSPSGNNAAALSTPPLVQIVDNSATGAACTDLRVRAVKISGPGSTPPAHECTLPGPGPGRSATCFVSGQQFTPGFYRLVVFDVFDATDPDGRYDLPGPLLSFQVT